MLIVKMFYDEAPVGAPIQGHVQVESIIAEVERLNFSRDPAGKERPTIELWVRRGESSLAEGYGVFGSVYVMNERGDTISKFEP